MERLAFVGLWCLADKSGRLEFRPQYFKVEIFPYDAKIDMLGILEHLCSPKPFIRIYSVENKKYIEIINFSKHQRPHHTEKDSTFPAYNGECGLNNGEAPSIDGRNPPVLKEAVIKEEGMVVGKGKEGGKELAGKPEFEEVLKDLNVKTGKAFKATTKTTKALIQARWNDGFRKEDFFKVHSNMAAKWLTDPKMQQYLRPETLYGPKFESYLNNKPTLSDQGIVSELTEKNIAVGKRWLEKKEKETVHA